MLLSSDVLLLGMSSIVVRSLYKRTFHKVIAIKVDIHIEDLSQMIIIVLRSRWLLLPTLELIKSSLSFTFVHFIVYIQNLTITL